VPIRAAVCADCCSASRWSIQSLGISIVKKGEKKIDAYIWNSDFSPLIWASVCRWSCCCSIARKQCSVECAEMNQSRKEAASRIQKLSFHFEFVQEGKHSEILLHNPIEYQ
jgi:hypothetical protein